MKIAVNPSTPGWPRSLGSQPAPEKNPWQMDRFELQDSVWDADRKVAHLKHQVASGHTRALVGMSVMFTSLGVMAAQSLATGGLPPALSIPLAVATGVGVTLFGHGLWQRDSREMDIQMAQIEARSLQDIYTRRFEEPQA